MTTQTRVCVCIQAVQTSQVHRLHAAVVSDAETTTPDNYDTAWSSPSCLMPLVKTMGANNHAALAVCGRLTLS